MPSEACGDSLRPRAAATVQRFPTRCSALAGPPLNGKHFNLNIIGAPKDKNASLDNQQRHTIMVDRNGRTQIYMQQGDDFAVIDGDGTDGSARFQLGAGRYEVYVVALGKPNKSVVITPEAEFEGE